MRKCEKSRRANTDARLTDQLQQVMAYCIETGHRPVIDSDIDVIYKEACLTIQVRHAKKIHVPDAIERQLKQIKTYPTASRYASKQTRREIASKAAADNAYWLELTNQKVKHFPKIRLMRAALGEEGFKRLLEKPMDIFTLKILGKYVDTVVEQLKILRARDIDIVSKSVGLGVSRTEVSMLNRMYDRGNLKRPSKAHRASARGLTMRELSVLFDLCDVRVGQIIKKTSALLQNHDGIRRMTEYYMSSNNAAMIAELSGQQGYRYPVPSYIPTDARAIDAWLQKQH